MKKLFFKALQWLPAVVLLALYVFDPFNFSADHEFFQKMPMAAPIAFACRSLQTELLEYWRGLTPAERTLGDTSFIKWLISPVNTRGFRKISNDIEGVPGKIRGVAFRVEQPFCFNLCSLATTCETEYDTVTSLDQEIVFDLTTPPWRHCVGGEPVKLQFDEAELMRFCTETDQSYITRKISMYLLRWEEALDAVLATLLQTQIGTNAVPAALTELPFFTASNQFNPNQAALNPEAMWALDQVYYNMGQKGQYAIIGGDVVSKMAFYKKIATFNAAGVDLSKMDGLTPYMAQNRNFNTLYGNKDFILFTPGAQQLVTWNKYKGEKQRAVTNLYSKGTIVLPTTGLEVDWKWWYDYDCEKWTFEAFLHAELATVPPGGCGANVAGVNGIIRVRDCGTQPIMPECPEVAEA